MSNDKAEVALKYLDLARGEILEKAKVVNQTLGAYLAGSAALASWFYQAVYKPVENGGPSASNLQKAAAAIGFALLLSYLGLAVFWIIYHNERIIASLAIYQRENLSSFLGDDPPMWERSIPLNSGDALRHARGTVLAEELIVLGPPVAALIFAGWHAAMQAHSASCAMRILAGFALLAALVANARTVQIGVQMREMTSKLREPAATAFARGSPSPPQPAPSHPSERNIIDRGTN